MAKPFRTAHAIAKKGRPFTDFVWMCELDEMKGLKIGETYRNHTQARNFVGYIAAVERKHFQEQISDAHCFSILSDGSTDSAVIEEEIVYAQYAMVFVQFIGLQSVPKADAQHSAAAITTATSTGLGVEEEVWRQRLVAIGSDGAAVMVGKRSGVAVHLSEGPSHVLSVHCMAHRLELSLKDAASTNSCYKKLDGLLLGMYYFYNNSALNRANLKASYESLHKPPLMPTRVGGTRWVSHILMALDHFLRGYAPIVQHLEQVQSPDSVGVRGEQKAKQSGHIHECSHVCFFLLDVLQHLSTLSCNLQKQLLSFRLLQSTNAVLHKYKSKAGPKLKTIEDKTTFEGSLQGLMHLLHLHALAFSVILYQA